MVQRDPEPWQPAWLLAGAPSVSSAGNPIDRRWLRDAGGHELPPTMASSAAVVVDNDVAGLYLRH